jgi:hypothetical protein
MTPSVSQGPKSLIDMYNEMPDGNEKSRFFKENREALLKYANKSSQAA